jgi:hypothetical protein
MEDLSIEELKQLMSYYRQRSSDLEFSLLQSQLKLNSLIIQQQKEIKKSTVEKTSSK